MKKIFAGLMVLMLLAVAVTPALAAGKPPAKDHPGKAGAVAPSKVQPGTRTQSNVQPDTRTQSKVQPGTRTQSKVQKPVGQHADVEQDAADSAEVEAQDTEPAEVAEQDTDQAGVELAGPKQNKGVRAWGLPALVNPHAKFVLSGTISAIDPATNTVVITPTHSNAIARKLLGAGTTVTLTMTDTTRFMEWTSGGTQSASLADLQVGDSIMTQGRFWDGIWSSLKTMIGLGTARQP